MSPPSPNDNNHDGKSDAMASPSSDPRQGRQRLSLTRSQRVPAQVQVSPIPPPPPFMTTSPLLMNQDDEDGSSSSSSRLDDRSWLINQLDEALRIVNGLDDMIEDDTMSEDTPFTPSFPPRGSPPPSSQSFPQGPFHPHFSQQQ